MKCTDCGTTMTTLIENYRYDECGLPYVVLEQVHVSRCPKCGAAEVAIPAMEQLHALIAVEVAQKDTRLTPDEVKYLRKYLGLSSGDFAEVMGVDPATVSRWENGLRPLGHGYERLLRVLVGTSEPACRYPIEHLRNIDSTKANPTKVEVVQNEDHSWETVSA